jgi:hypothetical protein
MIKYKLTFFEDMSDAWLSSEFESFTRFWMIFKIEF